MEANGSVPLRIDDPGPGWVQPPRYVRRAAVAAVVLHNGRVAAKARQGQVGVGEPAPAPQRVQHLEARGLEPGEPELVASRFEAPVGRMAEAARDPMDDLYLVPAPAQPLRQRGAHSSWVDGPDRDPHQPLATSMRSAIARAIASEEVAAGEGALRTWRARSVSDKTKSSISAPSRPSACALTPVKPGSKSPARSSGT